MRFNYNQLHVKILKSVLKLYEMIARRNMIIILSLTNNFYNKQFHQNKSIPRHMETPLN